MFCITMSYAHHDLNIPVWLTFSAFLVVYMFLEYICQNSCPFLSKWRNTLTATHCTAHTLFALSVIGRESRLSGLFPSIQYNLSAIALCC